MNEWIIQDPSLSRHRVNITENTIYVAIPKTRPILVQKANTLQYEDILLDMFTIHLSVYIMYTGIWLNNFFNSDLEPVHLSI